MEILITGATGFIGRNLVSRLLAEQHNLTIIGRNKDKVIRAFGESVKFSTWENLKNLNPEDMDVVINLAGESIAKLRWTKKIKQRILQSRVQATQQIVNWMKKAKDKKPHLYNASAIGIYGLHKQDKSTAKIFLESSAIDQGNPPDFLSEVGRAWENATQQNHFPVTCLRFGVVLKRHEGILKNLELPFKLGLGSVLGNGQQDFSWIHIKDLIDAIVYLINHPEITGPVNLVSPQNVTQEFFAKQLAVTLHTPLFLKTPAFVLQLMFGQMGEELLLDGQKVQPQRLLNYQFHFSYPTLESAFQQEWPEKQIK